MCVYCLVFAVMDILYKEFGRRLREVREAAHLSQDAVAKRVGLSRTSVTNIEIGRQHVALHMLYRFASAVGAQPSDLLPKQLPQAANDIVEPQLLRKAGVPEGGLELEWVNRVVTGTKTKVEKHK